MTYIDTGNEVQIAYDEEKNIFLFHTKTRTLIPLEDPLAFGMEFYRILYEIKKIWLSTGPPYKIEYTNL